VRSLYRDNKKPENTSRAIANQTNTLQQGKSFPAVPLLQKISRISDTTTIQRVKSEPNNRHNYDYEYTYNGLKFFHRLDGKRTAKFAGPIVYTRAPRRPTPKVRYKRKTDAAGNLIAHSLGGPYNYPGNFVAMDKFINGAGGDWGKMEHYVRTKLKKKGAKGYMSAKPVYHSSKSHRPVQIIVTAHFNRSPFRKRWIIATP